MNAITRIERDNVALARELGARALDGTGLVGGPAAAERLLVRDLAWDGLNDELQLELPVELEQVERWQAGSAPLDAYLDAACAAWTRQGLAEAGLL
jgi:hypothetical protein